MLRKAAKTQRLSTRADQTGANDLPSIPPSAEPELQWAKALSLGAGSGGRPGFTLPSASGASLWRLVWRLYRWQLFNAALCLAVATACSLLQPIAFQRLLQALLTAPAAGADAAAAADAGSSPRTLALWLFLAGVGTAGTLHRFWYVASRVGLHCQTLFGAAVLQKAIFRRSPHPTAASGLEPLPVSLHAVDAARANDCFVFCSLMWQTWSAALTVAMCVFQLHRLMGAAGVLGAALALLALPVSALVSRRSRRATYAIARHKDARGRALSEAVRGVLTLRLYGWLGAFRARVGAARRAEEGALGRRLGWAVLSEGVGTLFPLLLLPCILGLRAVLEPGAQLDPAAAFAALAWTLQLQFPLRSIAPALNAVVDVHLSFARLRRFFAAGEVDVAAAMTQWEGQDAPPKEGPAEAVGPRPGAETAGQSERSSLLGALPEPPEPRPRDAASEALTPAPAAAALPAAGPAAREPAIEVRNAHFTWTLHAASPASDPATAAPSLSFACHPGSLTLLCGPVGAGKSTLLSGLIGDAHCTGRNAAVRVRGRVAYTGQQPFVMNRSVRDNVVFASAFDACWYGAVLDACALRPDLEAMRRGDSTLVGHNGVDLSGGQRARLALARALYADADVYLIDDVLSALDAATAAHVWRHAIVDLLLRRGRTVLMATHAAHFAAWDPSAHPSSASPGPRANPDVGQVLLLDRDGSLRAAGATQAVLEQYPEIFAAPGGRAGDAAGPSRDAAEDATESACAPLTEAGGSPGKGTKEASADALDAQPSDSEPGIPESDRDEGDTDTGQETSARGSVKLRHLARYIRSFGSTSYLAALAASFLAVQGAALWSSHWLQQWTSAMQSQPGPDGQAGVTTRSTGWFASRYALISAAGVLATVIRSGMLGLGSLRASALVHNSALEAVLNAPAAFFTGTSAGSIANRFLGDLGIVDNQCRISLSFFVINVLQFFTVIGVMASKTPAVLLFIIPMSYFYFIVAQGYRVATRDLRRALSQSKSPLNQLLQEAVAGAADIRAFGPKAVQHFVDRHLKLTRPLVQAWTAFSCANEFVSTFLELLGSVLIGLACIAAVRAHEAGSMTPSQVGFLLTFAMQLPACLTWIVRYGANLETDAVSLERMYEYAGIEPEYASTAVTEKASTAATMTNASSHSSISGNVQDSNESATIISDMPSSFGAADVQIRDLWLRHSPTGRWVLKGVNLDIKAGCKVAVIGRSGGGKTTLCHQALLRFYPYERGLIKVGGIDIGRCDPADARRLFSPLVQDGFLFAGTLADNIFGPLDEPIENERRQQQLAIRQQLQTKANELLTKLGLNSGACSAPVDHLVGLHAAAAAGGAAEKTCAPIAEDVRLLVSGRQDDAEDADDTTPLQCQERQEKGTHTEQCVQSEASALSAPVHENGANLSAGERALICLARLLTRQDEMRLRRDLGMTPLRNAEECSDDSRIHAEQLPPPLIVPGVIIADEPTAAIDHAADATTMGMLLTREETLLCICHRLQEVPRFDRVVVVSDGAIVEDGPPHELIQRPEGHLSNLVRRARGEVAAAGAAGMN